MQTTTQNERLNVWQMFDRIAHRYDFLNHVLSMGIDVGWRERLSDLLPTATELSVLDLATGTADVPLTLCQRNPNIEQLVGMDLAEKMLDIGRQKVQAQKLEHRIRLETGDAMSIPVADQSYDAVTISFGIRNVPDVSTTLAEMYRVLKPGGVGLVLEFSTPEIPLFKQGYLFYLRHVLPRVGALVSGDSHAYRYLNQTIESFPYGQDFCDLMIQAGFREVFAEEQTGGIASIYRGVRLRV